MHIYHWMECYSLHCLSIPWQYLYFHHGKTGYWESPDNHSVKRQFSDAIIITATLSTILSYWVNRKYTTSATLDRTNSTHSIELCIPPHIGQPPKRYFYHIWSYCNLDLWFFDPKTNQLIYIAGCISDKSLEKSINAYQRYRRNKPPKCYFFAYLVMLWPWPLTFWPHICNQFISDPRCINDKSLVKIHLCIHHRYHRNNILDGCMDAHGHMDDIKTQCLWHRLMVVEAKLELNESLKLHTYKLVVALSTSVNTMAFSLCFWTILYKHKTLG